MVGQPYDGDKAKLGEAALFAKAVSENKDVVLNDYKKLLLMVDQIRVIDKDECSEDHNMLVSCMGNCARILASGPANFPVDLTLKFCLQAFYEYKKSSLDLKEFTFMIWDSVFSQLDIKYLCTKEVPASVLDTLVEVFAVNNKKADVFLEVVFYFASKCQNATTDFCRAVATHFESLEKIFSHSEVNLQIHSLIMRLYGITYSVADLNSYSRDGNSKIPEAENEISVRDRLLEVVDQLSLYIPECLGTSTTAHTESYESYYLPLHNVELLFYDANICKKAVEALCHLCCRVAWNCVMSIDEFKPSAYKISDFVRRASEKTTHLLNIRYHGGARIDDISMILTTYFDKWSAAQNMFDKIPFPKDLIALWVKILCQETKDPSDGYEGITIYSVMSSSVGKETLGVLLEQENEVYKEMQSHNQKLCVTMQMRIYNLLLNDIYTTEDFFLQKSRILIAKGRMVVSADGVEGLDKCIHLLSEAISTLSDMYNKGKEACGQVRNMLAEAYCLRALCTHNSKFPFEDIGHALKLWLRQEYSQSVEKTDMVHPNTLNLLYHVGDLLSLKGYMDFHADIYELMIRFCTCKEVLLEDCLAMLWQTRSLSHGLCTSHVNDAFISTLSKHCGSSKSLEFWKKCMEKSEPLNVGFQQCFSVISTLYPPSSCDHDPATDPSCLTIDYIKKTAFDLISKKVRVSRKALYLSSNLYHDLSEKLISNGSMLEAQSYAGEALTSRAKLFQMNFICLMEEQDKIIGDNGEIVQESRSTVKFHLKPAVATGAWSNDKGSSNFDFILTPWNILRCYLESILQVGTIEEIVGDGSAAEDNLAWGKIISSFYNLPIFLVSFSTILGKIYCKQQRWDLAAKELDSAKDVLVKSSHLFSCLKCKLFLEAKVLQQLGDLSRSRSNATDQLLKAENFYRNAVEKLRLPEWKNCCSNPKETSQGNIVFYDRVLIGGNDCGNHKEQEASISKVARKGGKAQNELEGTQKCVVSCGCEDTHACDELKCWNIKSSSLISVIHMRWECTHRRLMVNLLIERGKLLWAHQETQRAHEVFLESLSVLVNRNTFQSSNVSLKLLTELIENNLSGDMLKIEHATLLYNICWLSARSDDRRNHSFDLFDIPIPTVVSSLKLSLIGCREVPELFQKVSRLLAVLYTLSCSSETFSMLDSDSSSLSVSQWASYFHQASLGTLVNSQLFSLLQKQKDQNTMYADGSVQSSSASLSMHRLVCKSALELEEFIINFFQGLPRATIICMSVVEDDYASWLNSLFPREATQSWIMFSRLSSDCVPIVIVLPLTSISAENPPDEKKSSDIQWGCPWGQWGHTAVDRVAPLFRTILEERNLVLELKPTDGATKISKLDRRLKVLLRNIENDWFGPWKDLLLGGLLDHQDFDRLQKKLRRDLKSKCNFDVNENMIKAVTRVGGQSVECILELMIRKGCYIGGRECINAERFSSTISEFLSNAMSEITEGDYVDREPVILVLDLDIQMLPWESLPVLRHREVYRMPSVASIAYACDKSCGSQGLFPMIDPLDAYYFLNSSDGLSTIEKEAIWFKRQIAEGTIGTKMSAAESVRLLGKHDLFLYLGHAHGMPHDHDEIRKLEQCAATLLMSCSSGSLTLKGPYMPSGKPLSFLFGGSPLLIGNLWDVSMYAVFFASLVLHKWLDARKTSQVCTQCIQDNSTNKSFTARRVLKKLPTSKYVKKGKKKLSSKSVEEYEVKLGCKHKPRMGSFVGECREECSLPYLDGAAIVCYGVPTGIFKKKL